jgi:hypothetical protein
MDWIGDILLPIIMTKPKLNKIQPVLYWFEKRIAVSDKTAAQICAPKESEYKKMAK